MSNLTAEQRDILDHTQRRAAGRMYCCALSDPDMRGLVDLGLMECRGTPGFLPASDAYFTITPAGCRALEAEDD